MFFESGWLDLEDIKLICEQIFSFFFLLLRCNFVALVLASIATCKRVAVHGSKKAEAKNYILLHFYALFLPCTLSSSIFFIFLPISLLHTIFQLMTLSSLHFSDLVFVWIAFFILCVCVWLKYGEFRVLFTRPANTFSTKNNFKNGFHDIIHVFKNYFATFKNCVHSASN